MFVAYRGYTLVELITVLAIAGIVAAVAVPRLIGTRTVDSIALQEETRAALRYAQKSAVALRRTVCVSFTIDSVTLRTASSFGTTTCTLDLFGPGGETAYQVKGRGGAQFASVPGSFRFDAAGAPDAAQSIAMAGGSGTIIVEAGTGYVH
jgi:MSHA pilin protein MshC